MLMELSMIPCSMGEDRWSGCPETTSSPGPIWLPVWGVDFEPKMHSKRHLSIHIWSGGHHPYNPFWMMRPPHQSEGPQVIWEQLLQSRPTVTSEPETSRPTDTTLSVCWRAEFVSVSRGTTAVDVPTPVAAAPTHVTLDSAQDEPAFQRPTRGCSMMRPGENRDSSPYMGVWQVCSQHHQFSTRREWSGTLLSVVSFATKMTWRTSFTQPGLLHGEAGGTLFKSPPWGQSKEHGWSWTFGLALAACWSRRWALGCIAMQWQLNQTRQQQHVLPSAFPTLWLCPRLRRCMARPWFPFSSEGTSEAFWQEEAAHARAIRPWIAAARDCRTRGAASLSNYSGWEPNWKHCQKPRTSSLSSSWRT